MFARIAKVFGYSHDEILKMPMRRFRWYDRQVDRIRAEEDLRMMRVLSAVTSGETIEAESKRLNEELGQIRVIEPFARTLDVDDGERDPEFDRAALHALREKIKQRR